MPAESFPPILDASARVLVLGSMPGVASLEAGEYYAHPRNAFWPIMGELFGARPELSYATRRQKLIAARVAVWDVLRRCVRPGSLDAAIEPRSEVANDFRTLLARAPRIGRVLFNGQKAEAAFRKHALPTLDEPARDRLPLIRLPSTSPTHAGMSLDEKLAAWREAFA
ncbi:MAG: DNA-deoxyinosine glycosylase [Planctomycetota bacterium]